MNRCAVRIFAVPGWLLLLALSQGCGIKLAYDNADRLIRWSIDDYIELTRPQKALLDEELQQILYWHRTTQLPQYAQALRRLNDDITRAVGGPEGALIDEFDGFIETALAWGETIQARSRPLGNQLLLTLTPEQIEALPERLEKDNQELSKDEQGRTVEQNQARWAAEVRKGLQRFTGRLTEQQKNYLAQQAERYEPQQELWTDYRRRWQADVLELLQRWSAGQLTDTEYIEAFRALTDARETYYGEFGPVFERNQAVAVATAAGLLVNMTPAQQTRFSDRLLELIEDLEELVQEAGASP